MDILLIIAFFTLAFVLLKMLFGKYKRYEFIKYYFPLKKSDLIQEEVHSFLWKDIKEQLRLVELEFVGAFYREDILEVSILGEKLEELRVIVDKLFIDDNSVIEDINRMYGYTKEQSIVSYTQL